MKTPLSHSSLLGSTSLSHTGEMPSSRTSNKVSNLLATSSQRSTFITEKLSDFLLSQEPSAKVFVKYPDTSAFLEYVFERIEKIGISSVVVVPHQGYRYNLYKNDDFSESPDVAEDDFFDVQRDEGAILILDYQELKDILRLSSEERQNFMKQVGFFAGVDIASADKKTLEIITELFSYGDKTTFVFHSTGNNYVANKYLGDIFSHTLSEDTPSSLQDLIDEKRLLSPEFFEQEMQDEENFESELIEKLSELKKEGRDISSVGYCKNNTQIKKISQLLRESGFSCAVLDTPNPQDVTERLGELESKDIDIILTSNYVGGEMDIPFVQGAIFFTPPSNTELLRQVLPVMQTQEGKQGFIIDFHNWPIHRQHSIQNLISRDGLDTGRFQREKPSIPEKSSPRHQAKFPGIHLRLQYNGEVPFDDTIEKNSDIHLLKMKSDEELKKTALEVFEQKNIENMADIEILSLRSLRKVVSENAPLMVFLKRYGIGSAEYINLSNKMYVFHEILGISYLLREEYIERFKDTLQVQGILDYATCLSHPLKKSRTQDAQGRISFREMTSDANFGYISSHLLLQQNISDFDSKNRQDLADVLFPEGRKEAQKELLSSLGEIGIDSYIELLHIQYRMGEVSLKKLKDMLNETPKYQDILLAYDIYPSQFGAQDIQTLGQIVGFDISDQGLKETLGISMNADLKKLGEGKTLTYCWDRIVIMETGEFQKKILSQSKNILLFCKHFIDSDIKGSRITAEQKNRFADIFKELEGDSRLLYILPGRYKELLQASLQRNNLSLSSLEAMQKAMKTSATLKTYLHAYHNIIKVETEKDYMSVLAILDELELEY